MNNKEENITPKMAKILKLTPAAIIDITKYIGRAVKVIDITTLKNVFVKQLPKGGAKIRNMYDYGNCIA